MRFSSAAACMVWCTELCTSVGVPLVNQTARGVASSAASLRASPSFQALTRPAICVTAAESGFGTKNCVGSVLAAAEAMTAVAGSIGALGCGDESSAQPAPATPTPTSAATHTNICFLIVLSLSSAL